MLDQGGGAGLGGGARSRRHQDSPGVRGEQRAVQGGGGGGGVLPPLVHRATSGVHEEVGHCGGVEAQLAGDGHLHLLRRSFCFLKIVCWTAAL